ncbi:MAG: Rv3235 family protein [Nostocoides sp.]
MSTIAAWEPTAAPLGSPHRRPPESNEPYDALMHQRMNQAHLPLYIQGSLAVEFQDEADRWAAPRPTRARELPDPHDWAARMTVAVVEVLRGVRSLPQLQRWTSPAVYEALGRKISHAERTGTDPRRAARVRIRRVRVCEPGEGVAEVAVVLIDGLRVRAVALRLVGLDGRWRIDALALG